jgi:hypothetical protein
MCGRREQRGKRRSVLGVLGRTEAMLKRCASKRNCCLCRGQQFVQNNGLPLTCCCPPPSVRRSSIVTIYSSFLPLG